MVLRKLAFSNFAVHRVRAILTIAAIGLSVSLVVAVTSGYASGEAAAFKYLANFIGTTDAHITRQGDIHGYIQEGIIRQIAQDPDVERIDGRLEMESGLLDKSGKPLVGPAAQIIGIRRPEDHRVDTMQMHEGGVVRTPRRQRSGHRPGLRRRNWASKSAIFSICPRSMASCN